MLDLAHRVVAHPADDAAVERRELGQRRRAEPFEQRFEHGERALIVGHAFGRRTAEPFDVATARDERPRRIAAEEREPSPAFGVLDRFEEEPFAVAHELHERRQRRLEIGQHLPPDGHDGVVARQRAELVARRPDRGARHRCSGVAPLPKARKKQLRSPV